MTNTDLAGTRRRAALRGDEAVANWRIKTGTWTARLYAVVSAVPALGAVLWQAPSTMLVVIYSIAAALILLFASFRIARGSRAAAIAVLVLFVLDKGSAVLTQGWRGLYQGLLVTLIIAFGLVQAVWGTTQLRTIAKLRVVEGSPAA